MGRRSRLAIVAVLVVAGAIAARDLAGPRSVTIEGASLAVAPGEVRALRAHTSALSPLGRDIAWEVAPAWLGTVDEASRFRAGEISGSGELVARSGGASARLAVTVTCPSSAEVEGTRFTVACGRYADVYVDVAAQGGAERARDEVDRETEHVARELQLASERRFRVYHYGTTRAFVAGVAWLGRGFTSGPDLRESEAAYLDLVDIIVVDQERVSQGRTDAQLRHELVHRLLREAVGAGRIDEVPQWLNEGLAFLQEAGTSAARSEARVVAASSAHLGRLPALDAMTTLRDWNSRTGIDGLYQYYFAAEATTLFVADVGMPGVLRLLERVRGGDEFAVAVRHALPTFDLDAFAARLPSRVRALLPSYPGVLTVAGTPEGAGTSVYAFGLRPSVPVQLRVSGPRAVTSTGRVDPYGVVTVYIGPDWPTGEYVVELETDGQRFSARATR